MLKLYIYGYLNRVPSSRRLERECYQYRVDLADRTVGAGLQDHRGFPRGQWQGHFARPVASSWRCATSLICSGAASVAIDGSKFKAVNEKRRLERIDESIARYLSQLDSSSTVPILN
jgi:hypothetical protein